jgi:hypothetical protein
MSGSCAWDLPGGLLSGSSSLSPLPRLIHHPNSWHGPVRPPGRKHNRTRRRRGRVDFYGACESIWAFDAVEGAETMLVPPLLLGKASTNVFYMDMNVRLLSRFHRVSSCLAD